MRERGGLGSIGAGPNLGEVTAGEMGSRRACLREIGGAGIYHFLSIKKRIQNIR